MDTLSRLVILVPKPDTEADLRIARGSGIVAHLDTVTGPRILVSFEGNLYGASNLTRFDYRVRSAAGRLVHHYPTVARAVFDRDDFLVVGSFDPLTDVLDITNGEAVDDWCE